jgi:hypothetical protein
MSGTANISDKSYRSPVSEALGLKAFNLKLGVVIQICYSTTCQFLKFSSY